MAIILTPELLEYATRTFSLIRDTGTEELGLGDSPQICKDCDEAVEPLSSSDGHIIYVEGWGTDSPSDLDNPVVIVGCEGYWHIDPNLVGIPSENWS
jgi:hypothetical protein